MSVDRPITRWFWLDDSDRVGRRFELVKAFDVGCTLAGPSETGSVAGGFIRLQCFLLSVDQESLDLNFTSEGREVDIFPDASPQCIGYKNWMNPENGRFFVVLLAASRIKPQYTWDWY